MCTRAEVQDITDRLEREMHREFKSLKDERDNRIVEIAQREIREEKDSLFKFIGFGGFVFFISLFYYGGQITQDIGYIQTEVLELKSQLEDVNDFMNAGDRYTSKDGLELKNYVDQQDAYILRRVDDGFANISDQIERLYADK